MGGAGARAGPEPRPGPDRRLAGAPSRGRAKARAGIGPAPGRGPEPGPGRGRDGRFIILRFVRSHSGTSIAVAREAHIQARDGVDRRLARLQPIHEHGGGCVPLGSSRGAGLLARRLSWGKALRSAGHCQNLLQDIIQNN